MKASSQPCGGLRFRLISIMKLCPELGRDLIQLSRELEDAGQVLTSEEELEQELARRRGGYMANGDS